jgi:hypothetical protein
MGGGGNERQRGKLPPGRAQAACRLSHGALRLHRPTGATSVGSAARSVYSIQQARVDHAYNAYDKSTVIAKALISLYTAKPGPFLTSRMLRRRKAME